MNIEKLTQLADALDNEAELEKLNFKFDMFEIWEKHPECGTVGCIAGLAGALFDKNPNPGLFMLEDAAEILDLDEDTSEALFDPKEKDFNFPCLESPHYTKSRAARAVRKVIAGSRDPWREVFKEDELELPEQT